MEALQKSGAGIGQVFINLSSEYPGFLLMVYILMTALGVLIVMSGLVELGRMGKPGRSEASFVSVFWKMFGGGSLTILSYSVNAWTSSLWANTDPLDITKYVVSGAAVTPDGGYSEAAIMAATGIIVLTGVVTIARAYIAIARLGKVPEEQRGDLWGYIISRLVAGSALVSVMYLVKAFSEAAGMEGFKLIG